MDPLDRSEYVSMPRPFDADELKEQLRDNLDEIGEDTLGEFATFGSFDEAPAPGLHVSGLGDVPLPLSPRDAKEIAKLCRQAPFGKGSETIVDTSVRNTWELSSDQFRLRNPAWKTYFDKLVTKVVDELWVRGGATNIRAEPFKLLLYDEGAFFEKHKDSEKAEGMFGTLVVALPSLHTGGNLDAAFRDSKKTFSTEKNSEFGYSYLAIWPIKISFCNMGIWTGGSYHWKVLHSQIRNPKSLCLCRRRW